MPESPVRFICFQSLPARGNVGLKAYASILHRNWVPVPSLYLNGPANMPGCKKFPLEALEMLQSVVETEWEPETRLVLIIGYIADAGQIRSLIRFLKENRHRFEAIVIDPICGDNGKAYVSPKIIRAYPTLLEFGHIHFPNATELGLIAEMNDTEEALLWWKQRFLHSTLIVTGVNEEAHIGVIYQSEEHTFKHLEPLQGESVSGSGDLFLAQVAYLHFVTGKPLPESVVQSARFVKNNVASGKLFT